VPDTERRALLDRADALEAKYGNSNSPSTDDTTVTGNDGYWSVRFTSWQTAETFADQERRARAAWDTLWDLHRNQAAWNKEWDRSTPDEDDLISEEYKYDHDECEEEDDDG
jgi:hypothetical protein